MTMATLLSSKRLETVVLDETDPGKKQSAFNTNLVEDFHTMHTIESEQQEENSVSFENDGHTSVEISTESSNPLAKKNLGYVVDKFDENHEVVHGSGCSLSWANINARLKTNRRCCRPPKNYSRQILSNVNGHVRPGNLLAIIGASGAGKTTLLNVLTGRIDDASLDVQGEVTVNGVSLGHDISRVSVYVQQHDAFIGTLTVREHLVFRARLGMDKSISDKAKNEKIDQILIELGLAVCADTRIGVPGRLSGLSGGERKRLSFAAEILSEPKIMFCDEVTSGLDSFTAQNVVETLRYLAHRGISIICTIHQPPSEVYALFDNILLLASGRVAYMGPARDALDFFSRQGFNCPVNFNPADFYMQTLAVIPRREEECAEKIENICNAFETSHLHRSILNDIEATKACKHDVLSKVAHRRYNANWCVQFWAVLKRSVLSVWREPVLIRVRMAMTIVFSVLIGLFFLLTDYDQEGVQNINGALFLTIMNISFTNIFSVVNLFVEELPILFREHASRLYRLDVYFLAKMLSDFPQHAIFPLLYGAIIYWMAGCYPHVINFLIFEGLVMMISNTGASFGYLISMMSDKVSTVLSVVPLLLIPLIIFGGFFLNVGTTPVYLEWLSYLSWIKYSYELIAVNQWESVTNITCERTPCFRNGAAVLEKLNFSSDNTAFNVGLLFVLLVGLRLLTFFVLLFRCRKL